MRDADTQQTLAELLGEQGHSQHEIARMLVQVEQFDRQMLLDSAFDAIGRGSFRLEGLIRESMADRAADHSEPSYRPPRS